MADDINGLPDVDLDKVVADLESQNQDKEPETSAQEPKELDLGQFRNPKDLLKSYKEVQGAFTRVTQENKTLKQQMEEAQALKEELARLKEQQELSTYQAPVAPTSNKSFDDVWMENPEDAIKQKVMEHVNTTRIEEVLQEEDMKNHEEFQERYAYANMLAQNPQYAHLSRTAAGVKKLFEVGDKLRVERLKANSRKSLEYVFGEPVTDEELAKLKGLVKGTGTKQTTNNSDAYMPETSTSTMTGADQDQRPDTSARVSEAARKGDVDGVIDEMFKDILAE